MEAPISTTTPSTKPPSTIPTSVSAEEERLPTFKFSNVRQLGEIINSLKGDTLILTTVTSSDFDKIAKYREKKHRKYRLRRFEADAQILILTIPSAAHETMHFRLHAFYIIPKIAALGLADDWKGLGATTFRAQGHPGGDGGEGDSTGAPTWAPNPWPTLVIEAGDSEPLSELRQDMRWWFGISNHAVKIVLLVKLLRGTRQILLERWEETIPTTAGATTTRQLAASAVLTPSLQQLITISENVATNPTSYVVTRGDLILSFRLLFLRAPGPNETDIIIPIQELEKYARHVWQAA